MNISAIGGAPRARRGRAAMRPGSAFFVVTVMWIAFGIALAADSGGLGGLWGAIQGLWLPLRVAVLLFFLPWSLALWVWRADVSIWLRLAAVSGLAAATLVAFFPSREGERIRRQVSRPVSERG